jgi:hypothetical protein
MAANMPVLVRERHTFFDIQVRRPEAIAITKRRAIRMNV